MAPIQRAGDNDRSAIGVAIDKVPNHQRTLKFGVKVQTVSGIVPDYIVSHHEIFAVCVNPMMEIRMNAVKLYKIALQNISPATMACNSL